MNSKARTSSFAVSGRRPGKTATTEAAFDYRPTTRVVFGPGSLNRLGELVRELGGQRVLLVTDPGLEAAGHPQRAGQSLRQAGLDVSILDHVQENPTTEHVDFGLGFAKERQIDFIVAVGGGSSMDCAKGINFLLTNGGKMADYVGQEKAKNPMLPSIAIDALAHAAESYVTTKRNRLAQTFAKEAWSLLEPNFGTVLSDPENLEARGAMQLGAHFAGVAIENSMLGACHACANPLTAHFGLTHGIAIGVMLPHVIRRNAPVVGELYRDLAHDVHLLDGDSDIAAESLALRITEFMSLAGLPTKLSMHGVDEGILPVLAAEAARQWTGQFNPRPTDEAAFLSLYEAAL